MQKQSTIKEVDRVEIISLIDNNVDVISPLQRKEVQKFREWILLNRHFSLPVAEHGLSLLVKLFVNDTFHAILFDPKLFVWNINHVVMVYCPTGERCRSQGRTGMLAFRFHKSHSSKRKLFLGAAVVAGFLA